MADGEHLLALIAPNDVGNMAETSPLSVRTVNVQKANEGNYVASRDFGLIIGVVSGLAIGLIIRSAVFFVSKKKRKLNLK